MSWCKGGLLLALPLALTPGEESQPGQPGALPVSAAHLQG